MAVDLANAAVSLRSRPTRRVKELEPCSAGEFAMRAAYAVVDGVFETTTAAAFEFGCQRQHVNYYVRKLAGQGLARSESTQSSRSRRSESSGWSRRLSSTSAMSSSSHDDIENEPARNAVVPDPADDPWARYCMAYMYAGRLVSLHGRKVARKS